MNRPKPFHKFLRLLLFCGCAFYGWRWLQTSGIPAKLPKVSDALTAAQARFAPNPALTATPHAKPKLARNVWEDDDSEPSPEPPPPAPQPSPTSAPSRDDTFDTVELTPSNLPLVLPSPPRVIERRDARLDQLEAKLRPFATFETYRALVQHHLELGNTAQAAQIFRIQAALFRRKGLEDAAQVLEKRAAQYQTTLRIYAARADAPSAFSGAPLEPKRGCYVGAFIDRDDALPTRFIGDNFQYHRLPSEFETRVGRGLGSVFTYVKWGNFPRRWLQMCKEQGVIPQIAWEPDSLDHVQDNSYLRGCEQFLRDLDWPVWVRFAGEMNGDWTPYHGNPKLYRQKFALVNRVLHSGGARVATIWCVNSVPIQNIGDYYPGDANCDWVGVNLYSAPFADNDRNREASRESPLTLLDPIYRKYSARKPIAICEYAASHQAAVDRKMRPDFALEKMSLLYGALPLLYPRVKMISWFDSNNLIHAEPGRQLNNYRLTELPRIENKFRALTASPHFLTSFPPTIVNAPALRELKTTESLRRGERAWIWATGAASQTAVYVVANGRVIYAGKQVGQHVFDLKTGADKAVILVYDNGKRCVYRREVRVTGS